jgi:uncharacterized surface protein with fasciclin (FAS1) repeats
MQSRGLTIALLATSIAAIVGFLASDESPLGKTAQLGLRGAPSPANMDARDNGKDSSESRAAMTGHSVADSSGQVAVALHRSPIESTLPKGQRQRRRVLVAITSLRSSASMHLDNLQTSWGSVEPSNSLSIFTRAGERRRRRRRRRNWRQRAKRRKKRAKKDRKHKNFKQETRKETDDEVGGSDDNENNDNHDPGGGSLSWAENISKSSTKASSTATTNDKDAPYQVESVAACHAFRNVGPQRNLLPQQTRSVAATSRNGVGSLRPEQSSESSSLCNNNNTTVDQFVETMSALSTLRYMMHRADLTHLLSCTGPLTLLAPTNGSWERAFNATTLTNLLRRNQVESLRTLLLTHILPGRADNSNADVKLRQSLSGQFVNVRFRDNGRREAVYFNGVAATVADINTCNGVIYLLDSVIGPDSHAIEEPVGMFDGTGIGPLPPFSHLASLTHFPIPMQQRPHHQHYQPLCLRCKLFQRHCR